MKELKKRLTRELQQNFSVQILDTQTWSLPVHVCTVDFQTVERTKMDVLMKGVLMVLQEIKITSPKELSDILHVEILFIEDILDRMQRTGLVTKDFTVTPKGLGQFQTGIFEHEPEYCQADVFYSIYHDGCIQVNEEPTDFQISEVPSYRHERDFDTEQFAELDIDVWRQGLQRFEVNDGAVQVVVENVNSSGFQRMAAIPCMEFRLYNKEEDVLYVRIWNTLLDQWDEVLEAEVMERECAEWRDKYLKKNRTNEDHKES